VENHSKRKLFCLEMCRFSTPADVVQADKHLGYFSTHTEVVSNTRPSKPIYSLE
jgi:hypothetical protein